MKKMRQPHLSISSLIVLFSLLGIAPILLMSNNSWAEMNQSAAMSAKEEIRMLKDETGEQKAKRGEIQKCIRGSGCLSQDAAGEASQNGGNCSSGIVCSAENSPCSRSGGKTCKTWDMGGGNCGCVCN